MKKILVTSFRDEEAGVWTAESGDVPGLAIEAETTEQLIEKLKIMIPELLSANNKRFYDEKKPIRFRVVHVG